MHALDRVDGRARGKQRDLVRFRRRVCVGIERDGAARGLRDASAGTRGRARARAARSRRAAPSSCRHVHATATRRLHDRRRARDVRDGPAVSGVRRNERNRSGACADFRFGSQISEIASIGARAMLVRAAPAPCSRASRSRRADSMPCSSASRDTSNGSPTAIDTVANGFGICVRSQLRSVQCRSASRWNGSTGLPVALASQTAPGCATRAGPRGPSTVNPAGFPAAMSRVSCRSAFRAPRDVEPRAVPYPNRSMMPRDPLAVEILARDDDDAAAAEVICGGQDAAVPERHDRLAAARDDALEVLEPLGAPAQRRAERRNRRDSRRAEISRASTRLRARRAPVGAHRRHATLPLPACR